MNKISSPSVSIDGPSGEVVKTWKEEDGLPWRAVTAIEVDPNTGDVWLDRNLFVAMRYPLDYGFFPDTLAEDDDRICRVLAGVAVGLAERCGVGQLRVAGHDLER